MSAMNPAEIILTCPFDPSHRLLSWRMSKHINRCKMNHPDAKVATCSYNNTHIVPETELAIHLETCKDRYKLDTFIYVPEDCDRDKYPVNNINVLAEGEETWDDEDSPTYDPAEYCRNNKIIRRLDVASAATRKNFRLEERIRFQQFGDGQAKQWPDQDSPLEPPRRPVGQSKCVGPLAKDVDPQNIVRALDELKIGDEGTLVAPCRKNESEEGGFVPVTYGRGRSRRGRRMH